ncbi:MAG: hypothetical protein CK548_03450, partial [Opitutia bacterium]
MTRSPIDAELTSASPSTATTATTPTAFHVCARPRYAKISRAHPVIEYQRGPDAAALVPAATTGESDTEVAERVERF